MSKVIEVQPNDNFIHIMENLRQKPNISQSRVVKQWRREKALNILEQLVVEHGSIENIPDDDESFKNMQELLGVFDNQYVDVDTYALSNRIECLCERHGLKPHQMYQFLGYFIGVRGQTLRAQVVQNRLSAYDAQMVFLHLSVFERIRNMQFLLMSYRQTVEEFEQKGKRLGDIQKHMYSHYT